jgi:predicted MFS family arabinose efflux permease
MPLVSSQTSAAPLSLSRLKLGCFVLEGLHSFTTVWYFYYFYFFMQQAFGFDNKANLLLAALNGATYAIGAWQGGRFAQRFGYFNSLKLGFLLMLGALATGSQLGSARGHILVMGLNVLGMCFTWPALEALASEGETPAGLQHMVGIYNVVWAATGAFAYFFGGAALEHFGFKSLFYFPMAVLTVQIGLTLWLEKVAHGHARSPANPASPSTVVAAPLNPRPIAKARTFLRMAWLANPFAYIAINTLIAVVPGVTHRLGLSTMMAGFCCSAWCFARLVAFLGLWLWSGWHYRFRWLLGAFLALIASFALILMVPNLIVLVLAQVLFGGAVGLLYYSSLFYSMDTSDTKGEHGGIHEAIIGLGNFVGPSVGAATLHFLPQYANSGAVAVSVLLLCGLGGLLALWRSGQPGGS